MACCRPGDKQLFEPTMSILPMHICVTCTQLNLIPYLLLRVFAKSLSVWIHQSLDCLFKRLTSLTRTASLKLLNVDPLCGKSTGDTSHWWITLTMGQQMRKVFPYRDVFMQIQAIRINKSPYHDVIESRSSAVCHWTASTQLPSISLGQ